MAEMMRKSIKALPCVLYTNYIQQREIVFGRGRISLMGGVLRFGSQVSVHAWRESCGDRTMEGQPGSHKFIRETPVLKKLGF